MKTNHILLGIILGILLPILILWFVKLYHFPHLSFALFVRTGFSTGTLSPWLKIATLFNLIPFFGFVNKNKLKTGQGVVLSTIIYGLVIVYFTLM
jgi:hypothetical protein